MWLFNLPAATYTFSPDPFNLENLRHNTYWLWKFDTWNIPSNERITEAVLTYHNIWLSDRDSENILFTKLLSDPSPAGLLTGSDAYSRTFWFYDAGTARFNNWESAEGMMVGTWHDPWTGVPQSQGFDLVYSFSQLGLIDRLALYGLDGNFGFGIDPDCRFMNDGITFTITTTAVPEPGTILLLGMGFLGMGIFGRRKLRK